MNTITHQPIAVEPLLLGIADATKVTGISRSEIYRLLGAGKLRAVKHGIRTLIHVDSLRAYVACLPSADIHTAA